MLPHFQPSFPFLLNNLPINNKERALLAFGTEVTCCFLCPAARAAAYAAARAAARAAACAAARAAACMFHPSAPFTSAA